MKNTLLKITTVAALLLAPALAQAAEGFSTANVNMRAGPSTQYPAVTVIPVGESVEIHGCLADVPWCDVEFYGGRGWVAGRYVQALYQERRVYVGPEYYRPLGIPTVVFSVGNYWDRNYRNRDFYRDRDRWRNRPVEVRPDRGPDIGRPGRPRPDFEPGPAPRPGFDRGPDRRPDNNRGPGRRPDFGAQPDRNQNPAPGRGPDRRPDFQGQPGNNRQPDANRDPNRGPNRGNIQRPPQQNGNNNPGRRDNDRRRPPVCQPGDPTCVNRQ